MVVENILEAILDTEKAATLAALVRAWNAKGWSPATSTNYSFRNDSQYIAISKSGIDKAVFSADDFLLLDLESEALAAGYPSQTRSSAETGLHSILYKLNPNIEAVVHTHSVYNTILSDAYLSAGRDSLSLCNYELIKALGCSTHEISLDLPIFANTQDIAQLAKDFKNRYVAAPEMKGYLIAGHGLYTWGTSISEAKRHLEALEFLLECQYKRLSLGNIL
jgi:methylthioribulose-1-phosphate dehydratase